MGSQFGTIDPYETWDTEDGIEVHHFRTPEITSSETPYYVRPYFETSDGTYFDWFYAIDNMIGEEIRHYYENGVIN